MKRRDLIKLLEDNGWYLKRNGANKGNYQETGALDPDVRLSFLRGIENKTKQKIKREQEALQ